MAIFVRALMVMGLLLSGSLSGVDTIVKQLTAQIQTMEQAQARLCEEVGLCDTNPLEKMIQTMTAAQTRLQQMTGVENEPQGPKGPAEDGELTEANGPYQCALSCAGADDGCIPCEPNGPNGAGVPSGTGVANGPSEPFGPNGPYECSLSCAGAEEGCVPCEAPGPVGPSEPHNPDR